MAWYSLFPHCRCPVFVRVIALGLSSLQSAEAGGLAGRLAESLSHVGQSEMGEFGCLLHGQWYLGGKSYSEDPSPGENCLKSVEMRGKVYF